MTDENLPAQMSDYMTGLEDLDTSTLAMPRVQVQHKVGTFKDAMTGEEFPEMKGIMLGLIKQRVMWPKDQIDGGKPMCKSNDALNGYPLMEGDPDNVFPWEDAPGLDPNQIPKDEHGRLVIPCASCPFAQWTKDRKGKSVPPRCAERYTLPFLYTTDDDWKIGEPLDRAGIVAFQGSGIKPSKDYLGSFARSKKPVYSAYSAVRLEQRQRGSVDYSVPVFTRLGTVDETDWPDLSDALSETREMLRMPPRANDEGSDPARQHTAAGNVSAAATAARVQPTQQAAPAAPAQAAPAAQPPAQKAATPQDIVDAVVVEDTSPSAPAMSTDEDDLPF